MNTQSSNKLIYILIGITIIISLYSLWLNYNSQQNIREYYVKRDSSIEHAIKDIFENIRSLDTILEANNKLIRNNEGVIKNYYIANETKSRQILSAAVDPGRIAVVKRFLDSLYRAKLEEYK